jgi:hypothetical protein
MKVSSCLADLRTSFVSSASRPGFSAQVRARPPALSRSHRERPVFTLAPNLLNVPKVRDMLCESRPVLSRRLLLLHWRRLPLARHSRLRVRQKACVAQEWVALNRPGHHSPPIAPV